MHTKKSATGHSMNERGYYIDDKGRYRDDSHKFISKEDFFDQEVRSFKQWCFDSLPFMIIGAIIGLIMISVLVKDANAFFWNDKVERLEQSMVDYEDWLKEKAEREEEILREEERLARDHRKEQRRLFGDHCDALEDKQNKEREITDSRFITPCEKQNINLYFKIYSGDFRTVGR